MKFYPHFLGDYARDTAHLSMLENGAYRLMLDVYYSTAKPFPDDKAAIYRMCRAITPTERKAVDKVADEFFPVNGDGMRHNNRADKEIAKANAYADAQSVRANMRWHKQSHMPEPCPEPCPDDANHNHNRIKTNSKEQKQAPSAQSIWDFGVTVLGEQGIKEQTARSFLASLLKQWDEPLVESALRSSVGKGEVKSYLLGCLKDKPKKGQQKGVPI